MPIHLDGLKVKHVILRCGFRYRTTLALQKGRGVGVAAYRRISKLPATEHRFLENSAESRIFNVYRSRRFIKNVCQSWQINFILPQKKEKKVSLKSFQT